MRKCPNLFISLFRLNSRLFEKQEEKDKRVNATEKIFAERSANWWREERKRRKFNVITDLSSDFYSVAMDTLERDLLADKPFMESSVRRNYYGEVFFLAQMDHTLYAVSKSDSSDFCYVSLFDSPIKLADNSKIMVSFSYFWLSC